MHRSPIERAVRKGLERAVGKPMDQAVEVMMEYLDLVLEPEPEQLILGSRGPSIAELKRAGMGVTPPSRIDFKPEDLDWKPSEIPQAPLTELAPIDNSPVTPSKPRSYWDAAQMQTKILAESPPSITIIPEGHTQELTLNRAINQVAGQDVGFLLSYIPPGADGTVPRPKATFWSTEETLDIAAAVESIKESAIKMYRSQPGKAVNRAVVRPLQFAVGAEVVDS